MAADRNAGSFTEELAHCSNVWELAVFLARVSKGEEQGSDGWVEANGLAREVFDGGDRETVSDQQRDFVRECTSHGSDLEATNAIAWGIDYRCWLSFPKLWRQSLGELQEGRRRLENGDPFPVADLPLEKYPPTLHPTTRGAAKRRFEAGELPHVRLFDAGAFPGTTVFVDFTFEFELTKLLEPVHKIMVLQLNEHIDEIDLPPGPEVFPIRVKDEATQQRAILNALERIDPRAPTLVILPELSVTGEMVDTIQACLDEHLAYQDVMVVAGSHHLEEGPHRRNLSEGLFPNSTIRTAHRKLVRFTDLFRGDKQLVEGIDEADELVVYAAGIGRFATLICKDFLERRLAGLVAELGVTVLAVPAMSADASDFHGRARSFVADTQGFVAMTNGPRDWGKGAVSPVALVGQPNHDAPVLEKPASECPPWAALLYEVGRGWAGHEPIA